MVAHYDIICFIRLSLYQLFYACSKTRAALISRHTETLELTIIIIYTPHDIVIFIFIIFIYILHYISNTITYWKRAYIETARENIVFPFICCQLNTAMLSAFSILPCFRSWPIESKNCSYLWRRRATREIFTFIFIWDTIIQRHNITFWQTVYFHTHWIIYETWRMRNT